MKNNNFLWRIIVFSIFCFLVPVTYLVAQVQTARYISTNPRSNAFYEYLPQGYNTGNETYPLILFIHGMGELGSGTATTLPKVLQNGPPKLINQGQFPTSFTVNGETHKFIVISPQFTEWPGSSDINTLLNYLIQNYRVDASRIYMTGLSMGGGVVWEYAGGSPVYANRIAAIVPICGASWPDQGRANVMAGANLGVWATHNSGDPTAPVFYTNDYVNYINTAPNPPSPLAKKTIFNSSSHDAWSQTYNLNFRENGLNVFEWFLTKKRNIGVNLPPVPNAGADKTISLPTNSVRFEASATDPDGTISIVRWTKVSGPASGTIENPGGLWTNVVNLSQGVYVFRLSVTDNGGALSTDDVTVTVNGSSSNQLPNVNAGTDQVVTLPASTATLSGSASDPDGSIISYQWTKVSGPAGGALSNPTSAATGISSLTEGVYVYRLTVTDNSGGTRSDDVSVTVVEAQVPGTGRVVRVNVFGGSNPYANSLWNNWNTNNLTSSTFLYEDNTSSGFSATLSSQAGVSDNGASYGTGATVMPREVIRYNTYNTSNRTLTIRGLNPATKYGLQLFGSRANTGNKTVVTVNGSRDTINTDNNVSDFAVFNNLTPGSNGQLSIELSRIGTYNYLAGFVISEGGAPVVTNQPPVSNAGADIIVTLPASSVSLSGSGTDPDGTVASYIWTKVSGPAGGTISAPTQPNTNISSLVAGIYNYRLTVTDNDGATHFDEVNITVNAAATNQPPVANAGNDITLTLPANSATLTGTGTDGDGEITAFVWTKISGPTGGTITSPSSATTTITSLNEGSYVFRLTVTDNGNATATDNVTITVNAAPVSGGRTIKVNIFGGSSPYNNVAWNNWNAATNVTSPAFKYEDQSQSTVTAVISGSSGIADNGANYASGATTIPQPVWRFNSYHTSNRTIVLKGLVPNQSYSIDLFGSRANTGNKTVVEINGKSDTINTDNNFTDYASIQQVTANSSGWLTINLSRIGTYTYVAGFIITENSAAKPEYISRNEPESQFAVQDPEMKVLYDLSVFPNPVQNIVNIIITKSVTDESATLTLLDQSGRVVQRQALQKGLKDQKTQMNMSGLPEGVYVLKLQSGNKQISKQIIKQP